MDVNVAIIHACVDHTRIDLSHDMCMNKQVQDAAREKGGKIKVHATALLLYGICATPLSLYEIYETPLSLGWIHEAILRTIGDKGRGKEDARGRQIPHITWTRGKTHSM